MDPYVLCATVVAVCALITRLALLLFAKWLVKQPGTDASAVAHVAELARAFQPFGIRELIGQERSDSAHPPKAPDEP